MIGNPAVAGDSASTVEYRRFENFSARKQHLMRCASELEEVVRELSSGTSVDIVAEVRRSLREERFNVAVLGGFKRGKSTLINAMIGSSMLPMGIVPLTSVITKLRFGEETAAEVLFKDGRKSTVSVASIDQFVTEKLNPGNLKGVVEVDLRVSSELLKQGVFIIDTPGVGSTYSRNTAVAYEFLSEVDAALFVLGVDPPMSQAELDFLEDVRNRASHVFVILNKMDTVRETDGKEVLEFSRAVLKDSLGWDDPRIFALSAKLALEAKMKGDPDMLQRSGYPRFEAELQRFLTEGKADAMLASARARLARVTSDMRTAVGIEYQIAERPVAEMDEKMGLLRREIQDAKRKLDDFDALVDSRVSRMIQRFEEGLERAKASAVPTLVKGLEEHLGRIPTSMARGEFLKSLQNHITEAIERTYTPFVRSAGEEISGGLKSAVEDIMAGVDEYSRSLENRVAALFGVSVNIVDELPFAADSTTFYFDKITILKCDSIVPPELPMLLPKRLSRKVLAKKAREILLAEVDKHAGRIRYDFDYRLSESARRVKAEVKKRMLSSIESMESAYMAGLRLRNEASQSRDARLYRLREMEEKLRFISDNLEL